MKLMKVRISLENEDGTVRITLRNVPREQLVKSALLGPVLQLHDDFIITKSDQRVIDAEFVDPEDREEPPQCGTSDIDIQRHDSIDAIENRYGIVNPKTRSVHETVIQAICALGPAAFSNLGLVEIARRQRKLEQSKAVRPAVL